MPDLEVAVVAQPRGFLDGRLISLLREGIGQADGAVAVHLVDAVFVHWG
jgi:hypothetical protein